MNTRQKGLNYVREVRKILESMGHIVEGPGYALAFFDNRMQAIHRDYFGIFDLISWDGIQLIGHQVSDIHNKSTKIKEIQGQQMSGWVWARGKKGRKVEWQLFIVFPLEVYKTTF
jgi:hypothetical protein